MNLYLIFQHHNRGYNTYDGAVVVAENADIAKRMHPSSGELDVKPTMFSGNDWADPEYVNVVYLGKADIIDERKVICASFNAG